MNAGTPGQPAGPFDCPPALYARWVRADFRDATDGTVDRLWRAASKGDRAFWIELVAAQPQPAAELAAAMAEARELREQLAGRGALLAEILGTYAPTGSGHASKVGQVRVARWKRDAGMELTEGERRMAGA